MAKDDNGLTPLHRAAYWYGGRREGGTEGWREGSLSALGARIGDTSRKMKRRGDVFVK